MKLMKNFLLQTDVKNKNGRIYPREIFEKAVAEYEKKIEKGIAFGELGHPDTFDVSLKRVSHIITSITRKVPKLPRKIKKKMKKLGIYEKGVYEVNYRMLDTEMGKVALKNIESLVPSPRGSGSVDDDGVVKDDYKLFAIDLINKKDRA